MTSHSKRPYDLNEAPDGPLFQCVSRVPPKTQKYAFDPYVSHAGESVNLIVAAPLLARTRHRPLLDSHRLVYRYERFTCVSHFRHFKDYDAPKLKRPRNQPEYRQANEPRLMQ